MSRWVDASKSLLSASLVLGAILFVSYGIIFGEKRVALPRVLNGFLLILALSFLAYFESGQVAIVNLSVIGDKQSIFFKDKLPLTYSVYQTISPPGMVERYLIGRQLCVIALVFLISQLTSFPMMPPLLPNGFEHLLIKTGLPGVMITLTIGQLFPQLLADEFTLRFLNLRGSLFFVKISQMIESLGIFTHCSWIISYAFIHYLFRWKDEPETSTLNPIESLDISKSTHDLLWGTSSSTQKKISLPNSSGMSGEEICQEEIEQINPYKSGPLQSLVTLIIFIASTLLTIVAAFLIIYGLVFNQPLLRAPRPVLFFIFIFCSVAEFYLEGSQVAVLAIQHRDVSTLGEESSGVVRIFRLVNDEKNGVKRFLIGRQFLIVISMFTMASITSYGDYNQPFFPNQYISVFTVTGFIGVIFGLNTVQLPGQMIAKQYPTRFLNLPGMVYVVQMALFAESTGLMHCGWILFHLGKFFFLEEM